MDVTVPVPDERAGEFFEMFGRWLQGSPYSPAPEAATPPLQEWSEDDADLAARLWLKFSDRAKTMIVALLDGKDKPTGEELAERLGIPNGRYGVAGVLAWPSRWCVAAGRPLPVQAHDDDGQSRYSIPDIPAVLFDQARKRENGE